MRSVPDRIALLERRLSALEANPAASLRFGSVTGVEGGFARVQLPDGQNMVSALIPTMQPRVLKDQDIKMPDIGEPVVCAFAGQGLETGVLLGACYSPVTPDPSQPPHMDYHRYEDGTELWYDREEHKLIAKVKGDVEAEVTGNVQATIEGNLTAEVQQKASVHAEGEMTLHSDIKLNLRAPAIVMQGFLLHEDYEGNPGSGILRGSYVLREGSLSVPDDNISTGQQLIAATDAVVNGISFVSHEHEGVMPGPGVSGVPVGGGGGTGGGEVASDPNNNDVYEEYFNSLYEQLPLNATEKDKLLLCLPKIAAEEANRVKGDTKTGWEHLQGMFLRWFSGPGNDNHKKNPISYWVDWDWVMRFDRAREARDELIILVLSEKARPQLAEILIKEGKMGKEETTFFFSRAHWLDWERLYHQHKKVKGTVIPDGLMVALRGFTLKALCSGTVIPLSGGGHRICVTEIALYVYDEFKFTEKDEFLGSWDCVGKKLTLGGPSGWVYGEDFAAFRDRHGLGNDFVVLSQPKIIDDFEVECYVHP